MSDPAGRPLLAPEVDDEAETPADPPRKKHGIADYQALVLRYRTGIDAWERVHLEESGKALHPDAILERQVLDDLMEFLDLVELCRKDLTPIFKRRLGKK